MIDVDMNVKPSPFSGDIGWEIQYANISRYWQGVDKLWQESDTRKRDKQIATLLYDVIFLTGIQLVNTNIFTEALSTAKKKINKLSRSGYLLCHRLVQGNKEIPIYSVGPAAFKEDLSNRAYHHAFYKEYGTTKVLKILSVNQLFVRLMKNFYVKQDFGVLPPYTSNMQILSKKVGNPIENRDKIIKYHVISIRDYNADIEDMIRQLPKIEDKAIVICSSQKVLNEIHKTVQNMSNLRFTTDDRLFRCPLSSAFFQATEEGYEDVQVGMFE